MENLQEQKSKSQQLEELLEGIWKQNPIFVMALGMCPTLAVTVSAINSLAMGLATTFVLISSCLLISIFRNIIPKEVRIAVYILIIATFVTTVDYAIQAISLTLYDALGAFIQLIVVNCIILGRAEAHDSKNTPYIAVLNAVGMSFGFTFALFCIGAVREILGAGSLFGISLFGENFQPWVVMLLPPVGFIVLGCWLLFFSYLAKRRMQKLQELEKAKSKSKFKK